MRSLIRGLGTSVATSALVALAACSAPSEEGIDSAESAATTGGNTKRECIRETGQEVGGDDARSPRAQIGAYWRANGGIRVLGFPLGPVTAGTSTTGEAISVQWFERARLEYHPSLARQNHPKYGNGVLEGLLGIEYLDKIGLTGPGRKPLFRCGVSSPRHAMDQTEFHRETGCTIFGLTTSPAEVTLSDAKPVVVDAQPNFLAYYREHGGLEHFGHPVSEMIDMNGTDADGCEVELQRARGRVDQLSDVCKVLAYDAQVKPYRLAPLSEVDPNAGFGDLNVAKPGTSRYVQYFERGRLEYQPANIKIDASTKRSYAGRTYYVGNANPADDYTVLLGLFGQELAPKGVARTCQ